MSVTFLTNEDKTLIDKKINNLSTEVENNHYNKETINGLFGSYADDLAGLVSGDGGSSGGGAKLNINYGETAPEDTSMLWCKCEEPSPTLIGPKLDIDTKGLNTNVGTLPYGMYDMGCAAVGKKVYFFGGMSNGSLSTISVFDVETKKSEILSATLDGQYFELHNAAAAVGDKIYIFGGWKFQYGKTNSIRVFDTKTNSIEVLSTTLAERMSQLCVASVGTDIYIFAGSGNNITNTIQRFNTETNTIATLSKTLPTNAFNRGIAVVGTKIYLFGGFSTSGTLDGIHVYNTETDEVVTLSVTLPQKMHAMSAISIGSKIYLFGGATDPSLDTIYVFDTETETLELSEYTLPNANRQLGLAAIGTKVFMFGGSGDMQSIHELVTGFDLEQGKMFIHSTLSKNIFNILNGDITMELGVNAVYLGNEEGQGESVEAYLYKDEVWTPI